MKSKLILLSVLLLGIISLRAVKKVESKQIMDAWILTEVTATSQTIFNGSGYVKALYNSTETEAGYVGNFSVVLDTPNNMASSIATFATFSTGQKKTPPLLFQVPQATGTATTAPTVYPDAGIYISTACTVWKSVGNSGEARKTFILWSK